MINKYLPAKGNCFCPERTELRALLGPGAAAPQGRDTESCWRLSHLSLPLESLMVLPGPLSFPARLDRRGRTRTLSLCSPQDENVWEFHLSLAPQSHYSLIMGKQGPHSHSQGIFWPEQEAATGLVTETSPLWFLPSSAPPRAFLENIPA